MINKKRNRWIQPLQYKTANLSLIFLMFFLSTSYAATITVNRKNMDFIDDSQCGLREAIEAINTRAPFFGCSGPDGNEDRIVVPAGTYTTLEELEVFYSVIIVGEGQNQTFIETGDRYGIGLYTEKSSEASVTLGLEYLTLRIAPGAEPHAMGIFVEGDETDISVLWLDHVRVTGFTSDGIHIDSPNPNSAGYTTPTSIFYARNCLIDKNTNSGIKSVGYTEMFLEFCHISHNSKGGIQLINGPVATLNFCTIEHNSTPNHGGGIYSSVGVNLESHLNVQQTTVSHNYAGKSGGGIYFEGKSMDLNNSTISHNSAAEYGGGIRVVSVKSHSFSA